MYKDIIDYCETLEQEVVRLRRDFHMYPETAWEEIRTSSIIAEYLDNLGYNIIIGKDVCEDKSRMGLPSKKDLESSYNRAIRQGVDEKYAKNMKHGFTGVIGILACGDGPVVALRFDIDALPVKESDDINHTPNKMKFNSLNIGKMHACGHDGHISIGLCLAKLISKYKCKFRGTIKLIFQPAEEGVRGAKSIVDKGHLNDVDFLFGSHIYQTDSNNSDFCPSTDDVLATTKLDVFIKGKSSHAGSSPEKGNNSIQAAATAITNLYSIPRNSDGLTRINVGKIIAGSGRNIIADKAFMQLETRGNSTELNEYMLRKSIKILKSSTHMYDTDLKINEVGSSKSLKCSSDLVELSRYICMKYLPDLKITKYDYEHFGASEDFAYMADYVQTNGGKANYMIMMSKTDAPAHNSNFDFNEKVLLKSLKIYSTLVFNLLSEQD